MWKLEFETKERLLVVVGGTNVEIRVETKERLLVVVGGTNVEIRV